MLNRWQSYKTNHRSVKIVGLQSVILCTEAIFRNHKKGSWSGTRPAEAPAAATTVVPYSVSGYYGRLQESPDGIELQIVA